MPKSLSRLKHEESKLNSELQVRSQKENGAKNRRNWVIAGVLQGCKIVEFCVLFDPRLTTFCIFFPNYPLCIVGSSCIFVIYLILSYI